MDYRLSVTLTCLALSLVPVSAKPITIYTSEPIKLEQIPVKKEPEPKPTEAPIHAFIHAFMTAKPEEKKKPEPVESLPPLYTLYSPYYGLFAVRPVPVLHTPQPFLYKMKMFYQLFG